METSGPPSTTKLFLKGYSSSFVKNKYLDFLIKVQLSGKVNTPGGQTHYQSVQYHFQWPE